MESASGIHDPVSALLSRHVCRLHGRHAVPYAGASTYAPSGAPQAGLIFDPPPAIPRASTAPTQFSYNGTPNVIPPGRLNQAAVNYLNAFPTPTRTDRYHNNYLDNQSENNKYNTFDVRLDWNANAPTTWRLPLQLRQFGQHQDLGVRQPSGGRRNRHQSHPCARLRPWLHAHLHTRTS
jgi:hypothetical protein